MKSYQMPKKREKKKEKEKGTGAQRKGTQVEDIHREILFCAMLANQ